MVMENLRKYGHAPFAVAVIHGGPGAAGEMAPVARELAVSRGVLEPLQTAMTLKGQIAELETVLKEHGSLPVTLVGYSYGAVLSLLTAARHPDLVKRIILVSSAVLEERYARDIMARRCSRLSAAENARLSSLLAALDNPEDPADKNRIFACVGKLLAQADTCEPLSHPEEEVDVRHDIHDCVWQEVAALRKSGELLSSIKNVRCPVAAIHGDYDPHPAEGVRQPLSSVLDNFQFVLLEKCGHIPWREKQARETFFKALEKELAAA